MVHGMTLFRMSTDDFLLQLSPITLEAIELIKSLKTSVIEIGAGEGHWLRSLQSYGIGIEGVDKNPRSPDVQYGTHLTVDGTEKALLAVWPPDGSHIEDWVLAHDWAFLVICADFRRLEVGTGIDDYVQIAELRMPRGSKGVHSTLKVFENDRRRIRSLD